MELIAYCVLSDIYQVAALHARCEKCVFAFCHVLYFLCSMLGLAAGEVGKLLWRGPGYATLFSGFPCFWRCRSMYASISPSSNRHDFPILNPRSSPRWIKLKIVRELTPRRSSAWRMFKNFSAMCLYLLSG